MILYDKVIQNKGGFYMLISVDAGKDTTKACIKENGNYVTKKFQSKIYNLEESGDTIAAGNTHHVIYKDKEYLVGDSGTKRNHTTSKTDEINKICQYVAITQFITPNTSHKIDLITGCPATIFKNAELKEEYRQNIYGDGKVGIEVDEKKYFFEFERIRIRPEGSGITVLRPDLFLNKNTLVIDIGGQNLNVILFDDMVPNVNKMFSKNAGGTTIEQSLINSFESEGIENITNAVMRTAIINGYLKNDVLNKENTTKKINDEISKYIEINAIEELNKNNINKELYDIVFIGGTSFMLMQYLNNYFKDAVFMFNMEESQFANCKGFYEMGDLAK